MILATILNLTFAFAGGSASEFVRALEIARRRPVCVALDVATVAKVSVDFQSDVELSRRLGRALKLDVGSPKTFGFGPEALRQSTFYGGDFKEQYSAQFPASKEAIRLSAGVVKLETSDDKYLSVQELAALKWSRKLTIHWFLQPYRCAARGTADEVTSLRTIASAIGGKLTISKRSFSLDLDPSSIRRRWVAMFRALVAKNPTEYTRATSDLSIAILEKAPDEVIVKALQKPGSSATFAIPKTSPLMAVAERRVEANRRLASGQGGTIVGTDPIALADLDLPWYAEISANGAVGLVLTHKNGKTRIHL